MKRGIEMEYLTISNSVFENIKHIDEYGNEYWSARELMPVLDYSKWENFHKVIKQALIACKLSNNDICDHFPEVRKIVEAGATSKSIKCWKYKKSMQGHNRYEKADLVVLDSF